MEKAEKHILLVSANLDAEVISTVKKNQSELKMYANVPEREIAYVQKSNEDPFVKIVSQVNNLNFLLNGIDICTSKVQPTAYKKSRKSKPMKNCFVSLMSHVIKQR